MKFLENDRNWYLMAALVLIITSAAIYDAQLLFFHRPGETYFYMMQDLAFVPVQVLIVTIFIDRLLKRHEQKTLTKKIHVGIGIFFSETGNNLLKLLFKITENRDTLAAMLNIKPAWNESSFRAAEKNAAKLAIVLKHETSVLVEMKAFLAANHRFILAMLENSNLAEHDLFTDLLLAISHLSDELRMREDFTSLPEPDLNHLSKDISRVYNSILVLWLSHLYHIKNEYPFLYSLAIRSNPFNPSASVIINEA